MLQRFLIVLGAFVFSYNLSMVVHEVGHAITLTATGGELGSIEISPFSWSWARYRFNPEPMATSWGGFLWQTICGLAVFCLLWITASRWSFFGGMFAVISLAAAGIYMLMGAILNIGDSGALMRMGVSPAVLIAIAAVLLLLMLPFTITLGPLLNVGKGKTPFIATVATLSPILLYLLAMAVYNWMRDAGDLVLWLGSVGAGAVLVALAAVIIHYTAPWGEGPEVRQRALPINRRTCILSLALGAGIIVFECLVFPATG
jgi:hypothetical protein